MTLELNHWEDNFVKGFFTEEVVNIDAILLAYTMSSVLGLHHHRRSPMDLCKDDHGGSGQG